VKYTPFGLTLAKHHSTMAAEEILREMTINRTYPCPKCEENHLVYDGMLVWRNGPRPPRKLARKQVGFSPRADYERERIYHCKNCKAEFYEDMEQRSIHLYEEGVTGRYVYNNIERRWQLQKFPWKKK
jgi:hypothetical protein